MIELGCFIFTQNVLVCMNNDYASAAAAELARLEDKASFFRAHAALASNCATTIDELISLARAQQAMLGRSAALAEQAPSAAAPAPSQE